MKQSSLWLHDRLQAEPDCTEHSQRWKSILSRLNSLNQVDESTKSLPHDQKNWSDSIEPESAKNYRDQPVARACEQSESRGRTAANTVETPVRRDVGPLREVGEEQVMTAGELELAALAKSLVDHSQSLTAPEQKLVRRAATVSERVAAESKKRILAGEDVLGTTFCQVRPPAKRRGLGATYTPAIIVKAMVDWAAGIDAAPERVVDPGIGSGRFISAAASRFPDAKLVGIDIDPLALLMARANACVLGYADRLHLILGDYRAVDLSPCAGKTLYIGNPPYVRHHDIAERWKTWFAATSQRFGFKASKLAGLHIHFFLRTRELAKQGDYGTFITAAEWLDVNYGSTLRGMLADGLGGSAVHIIDPKAQPFADAFTTSAITCFHVGSRSPHFTMRAVHRLEELAPLDKGRPIEWEQMVTARKWSVFMREQVVTPAGFVELGELFRVHRGQVTGANHAWIATEMARFVPKRFLAPTVTKARELLAAGPVLASAALLKRVVDLPVSLEDLLDDELKQVRKYLAWARSVGAHESYVARHRRAWWAVELRAPAPVLVTYMARQAPAFVLNEAKARHLNIAHGLYPRSPLRDKELRMILTWLRNHVGIAGGRVYAGGLVKFEPKDLERVCLPSLEDIDAANTADQMDPSATRRRRGGGDRKLSL
jgi:hypothetical protein